MTSPVLNYNGLMAFSLPSKYSLENVPKPTSPLIKISEIKKGYYYLHFINLYSNSKSCTLI